MKFSYEGQRKVKLFLNEKKMCLKKQYDCKLLWEIVEMFDNMRDYVISCFDVV